MTDEEQRRFLIDLLKTAIRELLVYRTFCEKAKSDLGSHRAQEIDEYLNLVRNDTGVATQLGPDFAAFVEEVLQGPEHDADLALDAFLREWTPRSAPN